MMPMSTVASMVEIKNLIKFVYPFYFWVVIYFHWCWNVCWNWVKGFQLRGGLGNFLFLESLFNGCLYIPPFINQLPYELWRVSNRFVKVILLRIFFVACCCFHCLKFKVIFSQFFACKMFFLKDDSC